MNSYNKPTYTIEVLVPQHLDLTAQELNKMPEMKFRGFIEELRFHIANLINKKYPPFGGKMTEQEIIRNLLVLKNENGVTVIPPEKQSRYIFNKEIENQNWSLRYNSKHTQGINHWFFEIWETEKSNGANPLAQFNNPDTFFKNINSIIRENKFKMVRKNPHIKISQCVDVLRITNGASPAFNFSSALAKWIYLDVAIRNDNSQEDFYILDPCMGFGGRLGGALAACNHPPLNIKNVHYYGTDVNSKTHEQFGKIVSFWKEHISPDVRFDLYKSMTPAETLLSDPVFTEMEGMFDIALTSPPYYNTEQYSNDPDQSFIKYPYFDRDGANSWRLGFLRRMIFTTYRLLRKGGEFWLNISNVRNTNNLLGKPYLPLEEDSKAFAVQAGFTHIQTYNMITPNIYAIIKDRVKNIIPEKDIEKHNTLILNGKEEKYEPIFVFKKY